MPNKEKLLLISAISPFPRDSGGAVRIYHTIKNLSDKYDLYLIFFITYEHIFTAKDTDFLDTHTKLHTTFYIGEQTKLSHIRFGQPYWFSPWYNREIAFTLNQIIEHYQVEQVRLEFTQLLYLQDFIPNHCKSIFVAHDISTISFARRLAEAGNFGKTWINGRRLNEVSKYEHQYLPQFDEVLAMSKTDAEELKKHFNVKNVKVSPNGIEKIEILPPTKNKTLSLGYIGGFSHTPNQKAVEYFIKKIVPILEREHFDYRYYIAGKNDTNLIKKWLQETGLSDNKNIINLGFVKNTEDFFAKIDVLLVTLHSGSGTRIKVMEALGFGRKIISTSVGAEGIDAKKFQIDIADTPAELLAVIKKFDKAHFQPNKKDLEELTWEKSLN